MVEEIWKNEIMEHWKNGENKNGRSLNPIFHYSNIPN
jgi:hypothetical protein